MRLSLASLAFSLAFLSLISFSCGAELNSRLPPPNEGFYGLHNESVSAGATKTYTFTPDTQARYLQAGVAIIAGNVNVEISRSGIVLNPSGQKAIAFLYPPQDQYQIKVVGAGTGISNYTVFWNQLVTHMCIDADNDTYYKYDSQNCTQGDDCNDGNPDIHPGAQELCNGIDDNCDGYIDNGISGCATALMVNTSYYDGSTTNFSSRSLNLSRVEGMVLEKTGSGKIAFTQAVGFAQGLNLDQHTNISFNRVYIDSTVFPMLNKPATVYLYNITFQSPVMLRDGQPCPEDACKLVSYSGGVLVFNVSGFSVYSATGSCPGGALYGQCSSAKPKYCENGSLVDKCSVCNCSGTDLCQAAGTCTTKVCTGGQTETCGNDTGACEFGTRKCVNNAWTECTGGIGPATEKCNGIDDDCDGAVDEGSGCCNENSEQDCLKGICAGTKTCTDGVWGPCEGGEKATKEVCDDGLDNDCDGSVDENCAKCQDLDKDGYGNPASSLCTYPEEDCNDSDPAVNPGATEICNGKDDNCNGIVDEECAQEISNQTKLEIISMYRSGKSASQISADLGLPIETVRVYIKCGNGRADSPEEGVDCGGLCPVQCSVDYIWIIVSAAGAGILGFLLVMYFRLRGEGKELTWKQLKKKWS